MQNSGADQQFYWSVPEVFAFCLLSACRFFLRNSPQNHHNTDMIQSEFNQYAACDIVSPLEGGVCAPQQSGSLHVLLILWRFLANVHVRVRALWFRSFSCEWKDYWLHTNSLWPAFFWKSLYKLFQNQNWSGDRIWKIELDNWKMIYLLFTINVKKEKN